MPENGFRASIRRVIIPVRMEFERGAGIYEYAQKCGKICVWCYSHRIV